MLSLQSELELRLHFQRHPVTEAGTEKDLLSSESVGRKRLVLCQTVLHSLIGFWLSGCVLLELVEHSFSLRLKSVLRRGRTLGSRRVDTLVLAQLVLGPVVEDLLYTSSVKLTISFDNLGRCLQRLTISFLKESARQASLATVGWASMPFL